jgi:hypothetical protein
MATPVMPAGCLVYSDFALDLRSADPDLRLYLYAIVDCSEVPSEWDGVEKMQPRRFSFSRAVLVTDERNYLDTVLFHGSEANPYTLDSADYTVAAGYQTFRESNESHRPQAGEALGEGREYGVLEFVAWDGAGTTPDNYCHLVAVACETINDEDFITPGSSERQHIERHSATYGVDYFVSSYHVQWCLATSINRCSYEDRMSYCWPVFADRTIPPA